MHLSGARENKVKLFLNFLKSAENNCEALYILGDLFELWVGDDDDTPPHSDVIEALSSLSRNGVNLYVALGNRDFLIGHDFCKKTGATLLQDYSTIDLYGTKTIVTHGDLLCTKDTKYQMFRKIVRHPIVTQFFLLAPLKLRKRIAYGTQAKTKVSMQRKNNIVMDVEQKTVASVMAKHGASLLIHGHTHRPNRHFFEAKEGKMERIVLGDWYEQDSVLVCQPNKKCSLTVKDYLAQS